MRSYNIKETEQNCLSQEISDAIGFFDGIDIGTLIDNNGYPFINEYLTIRKANSEYEGEISLRNNAETELSFSSFFQWLNDQVSNGRKINEIGLMEAFLCGIRASSRFPIYPVLYYMLHMYLSKVNGLNVDISILDDIYNQVVEENSGIPFKIQDCNKDFNIVDAIKLKGGEK